MFNPSVAGSQRLIQTAYLGIMSLQWFKSCGNILWYDNARAVTQFIKWNVDPHCHPALRARHQISPRWLEMMKVSFSLLNLFRLAQRLVDSSCVGCE